MANVLKMTIIEAIHSLRSAGLSCREIARRLGAHRETVSRPSGFIRTSWPSIPPPPRSVMTACGDCSRGTGPLLPRRSCGWRARRGSRPRWTSARARRSSGPMADDARRMSSGSSSRTPAEAVARPSSRSQRTTSSSAWRTPLSTLGACPAPPSSTTARPECSRPTVLTPNSTRSSKTSAATKDQRA